MHTAGRQAAGRQRKAPKDDGNVGNMHRAGTFCYHVWTIKQQGGSQAGRQTPLEVEDGDVAPLSPLFVLLPAAADDVVDDMQRWSLHRNGKTHHTRPKRP